MRSSHLISTAGRWLLLAAYFLIAQPLFLPMELDAQAPKENPARFKAPDSLSVTKHSISIGGKTLAYTASAGYITLQNDAAEPEACIFFVAYTLDQPAGSDLRQRPLTFAFNGGPGSSSVWLHLGVLGPKRILMTDEGESLPPPYQLVANEATWLTETDLVFIDPVTTGFSRTPAEADAKKYHGYSADITSVGEFIKRYTAQNQRWGSPKYLIGESYGTTRAAALSLHLLEQYGMYLNGVVLVSNILNFQTARFEYGNDLPYVLFLPTYAATAHFHKRLSPKYQAMPLEQFLKEVEKFAYEDYSVALLKGDALPDADRKRVTKLYSEYTGLSELYIERSDLRVNIYRFTKELMRDQYKVVGRFDSRYTSVDMNANGESGEIDPSYQPVILGGFSTLLNDYLGRELRFQSALTYNILTGKVHPWDYSAFTNRYVNTADHLRRAMVMNPHMKVWVANGYYDLATPYFATDYTFDHLGLPPHLRPNVQMTYYPAGHMMYLQKKSLLQLHGEAKAFYQSSKQK